MLVCDRGATAFVIFTQGHTLSSIVVRCPTPPLLAFDALSYLPDTIALCLPLPWSLPWSLPLHCGFASSSRPCGRAPGIVARYRRPVSPPGIVNAVVILRRNPSGVRSAPMPFPSTSPSRSRRSWRSAIKTIPRPASCVALWSARAAGGEVYPCTILTLGDSDLNE